MGETPRQHGSSNLRRGGPGRPPGSRNKTTLEILAFADRLIGDKEYQRSLRQRILDGKADHIEKFLWEHRYGKPKERVEVTGEDGAPLAFTLDLSVKH